MLNVKPPREQYSQFFILFTLCSLIFVMVKSIGAGIMNIQDNFYQKFFLVGSANLLRMKLGDRVFPVALMGKDGWMEYTGEGNIDDFQHARTLGNIKDFGKEITTLHQYLKSQGITLLIVVAPDKSSIYPDKFPEQLLPKSAQSRLDILISYLEDNNLPVMVDLRPALLAASKKHDVYYKTDTHWNGYGALAAYTTIINTLGSSYPDLQPYRAEDLKLVTTGPDLREIPGMLNTPILEFSMFFTSPEPFVQTLRPGDHSGYNRVSWIPDSDLPKLLMFHDSFGVQYLNEYLSMNFSESHFVHLSSMPQYLTKESLLLFKPDVVVIEIVERKLQELPMHLSSFVVE